MRRYFSFALVAWLLAGTAFAQAPIQQPNPISFTFTDEKYTDNKPIKLEASEYIPQANSNGKVIIFSHGSMGGVTEERYVKESYKYLNISRHALNNGYTFIVYMRKGRGKSEGEFTEELGKCSWGETQRQVTEAELQLQQVVAQVKERYKVSKVILMGHSRGGYLSSFYAAKHPEDVQAVVNLAGVWNAACQFRDGNATKIGLEESAKKFKPQFWAYFDYDTYFMSDTFNDPKYEWLRKTANDNGLTFNVFSAGNRKDGHEAPTWIPYQWATEYFPKLNEATK